MSLKGKTIIITGASRRIGRAMALAVAKSGGNVIIHHNSSPDQAAATKKEIENIGRSAEIIQADFTDPAATISIFEKIFKSQLIFGLVNNASIFVPLNWEDTQLDDWNQHLSINLTVPFLLSQSFRKSLSKQDSGRIVNILDWRAFRPGADHFPYTISKAGLAALTKSLAVSFAPQITVNGIAFGAILPPSDGGSLDNVLSEYPIPRWAELSEVEDTLLFLLTGPSYITGDTIHLDGGKILN
jgi:NAD(P)-dependent dehydrogenase (short-subunit alcohol dehydrogenase family)